MQKKRNVLSTPRVIELKKKKKQLLRNRIIAVSVLSILFFALISFISTISKLNIASTSVEGNKIIDKELIEQVVERETHGNYLKWFFPKTNIFLYPKNSIKKEISNEFKRFEQVDVTLKDRKILLVTVKERDPEYLWCGVEPKLDLENEICYFLDKEGYIFDEAPYFSGEVYFKFYGEPSGDDSNPEGSYFAKDYFTSLIVFKNILKDMNLEPVVIYEQKNGNINIYLSREKVLTEGPKIILKRDADVQKTAENLKAALKTEPLLTKFKNEYNALEYIDLRFGNKVYYKFKTGI